MRKRNKNERKSFINERKRKEKTKETKENKQTKEMA